MGLTIADDIEWIKPLTRPDLKELNALPAAAQASVRNQMITARMYIADLQFHDFEVQLTREMQAEGLAATTTILSLTTAATLFSAAATKTIFSAIATLVTGGHAAYLEKVLLSHSIQNLQSQMRADRKAHAAVMLAKMMQENKNITPIDQYTLTMALADTDEYYQRGTVASGIIGLSKTVATAEANADTAKAEHGPNPDQVSAAKRAAAPLASPTVVTIVQPPLAPGSTRPFIPIVDRIKLLPQDKALALARLLLPKLPERPARIQTALGRKAADINLANANAFVLEWFILERDSGFRNEITAALNRLK